MEDTNTIGLYCQPDEVLELAVLLGVNDTKDPQGGFAHTNLVTVLNKKGVIVHPENTVAALRYAVQD